MDFDVFNGDADGICALVQLRLHTPKQSTRVTGVKRDIQLLNKITVNNGDQLTVLDISLRKNKAQVCNFLATGARIFYVDHHQSGDIPTHPHLHPLINTQADVCTSLLVNQHLQHKYPLWAIVGASGDNLLSVAAQLGNSVNINAKALRLLENLGIYINYNSYGDSVNDLHFTPDELYSVMLNYTSPFEFIHEQASILNQLRTGYHDDIHHAQAIQPVFVSDSISVFVLPDMAWARRISGVFSNYLARTYPTKAHGILTHNKDASFQVSVRAPLTYKFGADRLCARFPSGGGRKSAAGINHLPADNIDAFIQQFDIFYRRS